ncbi:hypothetical protein ASPACDRAFT_34521 [Aspergillus aculeatus ATCC 16872]|uniref:Uncharacterized protein n=1 Tax=Aspergillus aculeatus (strain ATCC 16872 / CBS 172.66 / WB 5094) TaxID=690307 RepID=A0A1L9WK68_ASPA1|nr:uncharacterized protein ASPACDRAFT_34521 [Aspergillus aculeatus ATCC 16872]OJJ96558.1 hypothetical protein ASPACDRAFT_34521 [Aspergillus aculeatus ATCC 16872]
MTDNTTEIQGFASRRNNTCLTDEVSCGRTWDTWYACCPSGSYCPGSKVSIANNVCCPSWTDCTAQIEDPPVCADAQWALYNYSGYFCCEGDTQGFGVKEETWVGCAPAGFQGDASFSALNVIAQGTATTTGTSGAAVSSTTTTMTTTIASTAHSHGVNKGAVAGGVVGGVLGVAALAVAIWLLMRRRKKTQSPGYQPGVSSQPQNAGYMYEATGESRLGELHSEPTRIELVGHKDQLRHELP